MQARKPHFHPEAFEREWINLGAFSSSFSQQREHLIVLKPERVHKGRIIIFL